MKEVAVTLGTLEIESVWVIDRVGGGQYQGLVALALKTDRVHLVVAWVDLLAHAFQVPVNFVSSTGHKAVGVKSCGGATVILEGAPVATIDTPESQREYAQEALRVRGSVF